MKKFNVLTILLVASIFFTRCTDEAISTPEELVSESLSDQILRFDDEQQLSQYINRVSTLNLDELQFEEDSRGIVSFGREAKETYVLASETSFSSRQEIESFVRKHSKYLEIALDENGEEFLRRKFQNNIESYVMNSERLWQVDNKIFKVFENGIASTDVDNIKQLLNIEGSTFNEGPAGLDFHQLELDRGNSLIVKPCGTYDGVNSHHNQTIRDGNQKTILSLELKPGLVSGSYVANFGIQSQKRFLRIWWPVKRNTSAYWNVSVNYWNGAVWEVFKKEDSFTGEPGTVLGWTSQLYIDNSSSSRAAFFLGYYAFGVTGSTGPNVIECHKSLTCATGLCPDPVPDPCENVTCPWGFECRSGVCVDACQGKSCINGYHCENGTCVPNDRPTDPCQNVDCRPGERCVNGRCLPF